MAYATYVGRRALAQDVLGPNLVSNGHFTSATTGWTGQGSATLSKTVDGQLRVTNGAAVAGWADSGAITVVAGTLYCVDVDSEVGTSSACTLFASTNATSGDIIQTASISAGATTRFYFVAPGTTVYILLKNDSSTSGHYTDFDNVQVRKVVVRGHATSIEHVTNGIFTRDAQWTKGTGWTISGGVASSDGTQPASSDLVQQVAGPGVRIGKTYDTVFTVSGRSAGSVSLNLGGIANGTSHSADGTYSEAITANSNSTTSLGIYAVANSTFVGNIDNVSVKLAADQTWSLDFTLDANGLTPGRVEEVRQRATMSGVVDTVLNSSVRTLSCTTTRLAYGTWQFFEEFADNARDGQTITFDPYGTEDEPVAPGSYVLTNWSLARVFGAQTTEERQYTFTVREA